MRTRHLLTALLASTALLTGGLVGCATPQSDTGTARSELQAVNLSTAPSAEGNLVLRLENKAQRPLKVNLCQATLHIETDGQWQPSEATIDWLSCNATSEAMLVNPGAMREAAFNPVGLEPGRYRFTTPIEMPVGLDFKQVTSGAFDIVPPPARTEPAEPTEPTEPTEPAESPEVDPLDEVTPEGDAAEELSPQG